MDDVDLARLSPDESEIDLAGPHYLETLGLVHRRLRPRTYLEIGTRYGLSLREADCASLAVDPGFALEEGVVRSKPVCLLYQCTSDDFFAAHDPAAMLGGSIDLAFIDGLHQFEFALRDFLNTERYAKPGSVIILDDCCPRDLHMTRRTLVPDVVQQTNYPGWWTGDVWKMIPVLREYRPEIELRVIDTVPTGLAVCTNLDPNSRVLAGRYEEIVARWSGVRLEDYGLARLLGDLRVESAQQWMGTLSPLHAGDVELPDPGPRQPTTAEALAINVDELGAELDSMRRSRSWRWTSLVRRLKARVTRNSWIR